MKVFISFVLKSIREKAWFKMVGKKIKSSPSTYYSLPFSLPFSLPLYSPLPFLLFHFHFPFLFPSSLPSSPPVWQKNIHNQGNKLNHKSPGKGNGRLYTPGLQCNPLWLKIKLTNCRGVPRPCPWAQGRQMCPWSCPWMKIPWTSFNGYICPWIPWIKLILGNIIEYRL